MKEASLDEADLALSAWMHPPFIYREEGRAQVSGQCGGAHATICPLRGGPSLCDGWCAGITYTTSTHQVIYRLLTSHPQNVHLQALKSTDDCTRATSYGCCRDLFRTTAVPSRCISPCSVAQIPAACTTRSTLLCANPLRWDRRDSAWERKPLDKLSSWPPSRIVESCVQVQSFNTIQFRSCMRESRREGVVKLSGLMRLSLRAEVRQSTSPTSVL